MLSVSLDLNDWLTRGSSRTEANWRWMIWISMGVMPLLYGGSTAIFGPNRGSTRPRVFTPARSAWQGAKRRSRTESVVGMVGRGRRRAPATCTGAGCGVSSASTAFGCRKLEPTFSNSGAQSTPGARRVPIRRSPKLTHRPGPSRTKPGPKGCAVFAGPGGGGGGGDMRCGGDIMPWAGPWGDMRPGWVGGGPVGKDIPVGKDMRPGW
eukprot:scaffold19830_cov41-Phaeocystis_antarctica.AAC.2